MSTVYLVRHAAASGQEPDAPLTQAGREQALRLAELLLPLQITRVISSPYTRALETITPFAARASIHVEPEPRLVERVLSGAALADWRDHLRRSFDEPDYLLEGGESSRTAQTRGRVVLDAAISGTTPCLLVTHGNLLALILQSIDSRHGYDFWAGLSNPDVYAVRSEPSQPLQVERLWTAR